MKFTPGQVITLNAHLAQLNEKADFIIKLATTELDKEIVAMARGAIEEAQTSWHLEEYEFDKAFFAAVQLIATQYNELILNSTLEVVDAPLEFEITEADLEPFATEEADKSTTPNTVTAIEYLKDPSEIVGKHTARQKRRHTENLGKNARQRV